MKELRARDLKDKMRIIKHSHDHEIWVRLIVPIINTDCYAYLQIKKLIPFGIPKWISIAGFKNEISAEVLKIFHLHKTEKEGGQKVVVHLTKQEVLDNGLERFIISNELLQKFAYTVLMKRI